MLIIYKILFIFLVSVNIHGILYAGKHVLHPVISIKDTSGIKTCAPCHDTFYINQNNIHHKNNVKADCFVCHVKGSKIRSAIHKYIQLPSDDNCAYCHGLTSTCTESLFIPENYSSVFTYKPGRKYYGITQYTGVIIAPSNISDSKLNIKNKKKLNYPWDIHARRQLNCISCHYTRNDPRNFATIKTQLDHLIRDPRRIKPPNEYLKWPDHNLKAAKCTSCHNPFIVHKNLPFKKRHMKVVACQSCHVPKVYGPAFRVIDETIINKNGHARVELRGSNVTNNAVTLNTIYFSGYKPFLLPVKEKGGYKIYPHNIVTSYYWKDEASKKKVPLSIIKKVYLKNAVYRKDILNLFDKNKNGKLEERELVLNTNIKLVYIKKRLQDYGVIKPVLKGEIIFHRINHGVMSMKKMKRNCYQCHGNRSNFNNPIILSQLTPFDIFPQSTNKRIFINGTKHIKNNFLSIKRNSRVKAFYIFGQGRHTVLNTIGFIIFLLSGLVVVTHAGMRIYYSAKAKETPDVKRVYMYAGYERFWHWTMALSIILLIITGLEIHFAGTLNIFGLENTVIIHNILAFIMVLNAGLSLFYHITTGEIKQFFNFKKGFFRETVAQSIYYIHGIFKGDPHPVHKTIEHKLNPLQQFTYVMLLNILLPLQVITGILMWSINEWPGLSNSINGLNYIAPLHNFGSWLIITFLVVHVYLTTTGHTIFSNINAMITGYDEIIEEPSQKIKPAKELLSNFMQRIKRKKDDTIDGIEGEQHE